MAVKIAANIVSRMIDGIADPGLRREMHNPINIRIARGQAHHRLRVRYIQFFESKAVAVFQISKPGLFQRWIVVTIKIIDSDNTLPAHQQELRHMHPDKSCGASQKYRHTSLRSL